MLKTALSTALELLSLSLFMSMIAIWALIIGPLA
jgi:hypothetical protein